MTRSVPVLRTRLLYGLPLLQAWACLYFERRA